MVNFVYILVSVLGGMLILGMVILRNRLFSFPWVQFYIQGKDSGFSFQKINFLRRVVVESKLQDPMSIFWSKEALKIAILHTYNDLKRNNTLETQKGAARLGQLLSIRRDVDQKSTNTHTLRNSRAIVSGQKISVAHEDSGVYNSHVVENLRRYLAIAYPDNKDVLKNVSWQNANIVVTFWSEKNFGYVFQSQVLGDYFEKNFHILHIAHADKLRKARRRDSLRKDLSVSGRLSIHRNISDIDEAYSETEGYRCRFVDISEGGAAVIIGGSCKVGAAVKLQVLLQDNKVVMRGTVITAKYFQEKKVSRLHIKARPPSQAIQNNILLFIYNIDTAKSS